MSENFHTCENCDIEASEYDGLLYPEEGTFICDTCYGKQMDEDYAMMQDVLALQDSAAIHKNYPHLNHFVEMQRNDPVNFYTACKDNPEGLGLF